MKKLFNALILLGLIAPAMPMLADPGELSQNQLFPELQQQREQENQRQLLIERQLRMDNAEGGLYFLALLALIGEAHALDNTSFTILPMAIINALLMKTYLEIKNNEIDLDGSGIVHYLGPKILTLFLVPLAFYLLTGR